jgi:hypothetical protein
MLKTVLFKVVILQLFLIFTTCNNGVEPQTELGSISGKLLHPDNNAVVRIISAKKVDTLSPDPATQIFTLKNLEYGSYILQVKADGYSMFEQKIVLNSPLFICPDIVLSRSANLAAFLYPSSYRNLDKEYFDLLEPQVNDSGFDPEITFNDYMDTASVNAAMTIFPDTAGVLVTWFLERSIAFHFPYWKLATVDTVRVVISTKAINKWGDSLDTDYIITYPVDADYIRANLVKKN